MENQSPSPTPNFNPVSNTARIVAAKRAIEQFQAAPLFQDPFSEQLVQDEVTSFLHHWREIAQTQGIPIEDVIIKRTRYVAVRTRFIDDLLRTAFSQSRNYQVVILGAGLDTRVFRFHFPENTSVYEVDHLDVLRYKSTRLQDVIPRCVHHLVSGDLADPSAVWVTELFKAGYRDDTPTIWILEGVIMYLEPEAAHALLRTLSAFSTIGSILGMDSVSVGSVQAAARARLHNRGQVIQYWRFGENNPQQLLASYGWEASADPPQTIENGYGRYPDSIPIEASMSDSLPSEELTEPQQERGVWLVKASRTRIFDEKECNPTPLP